MSEPFVLLDDAGPGGTALLYRRPAEVVEARRPAEVAPALARLRAAIAGGRRAAGFLSYEAGAALEPKLAPIARAADPDAPPLLWFGLFAEAERLDDAALGRFLGDPAGAHLGPPRPLVPPAWYEEAVARVQALIAAGDLYQANLTFPAEVPIVGSPRAAFARLRAARAGWGALVRTATHWLLSASPELFFSLADGLATARPMKGTAARRPDRAADRAAAEALVEDLKQRAENLMIVDLMRNDLGRIAAPGGVSVPRLFEVETYPTVHQMTSTVEARLAEGRDAVDLLAALMPCGSITGAPKIRAMEVIDAVERRPRGVYTGAIGHIEAQDRAAFNVAIRTIVLAAGETEGRLGLGSAVTSGSDAAEEWAECLVKGRFVTAALQPFDLIETMRFEAREGFVELERHLARMKASAAALGFAFDRHGVRNELQAASFSVRHDARVRLRLDRAGHVAIEVTPFPDRPEAPVPVAIVPLPVAADDFRLRHKTSDRAFYDEPRRAAGTWEVVFVAAGGGVTEGSFTSLFVERDGILLTPPLALGLQPGVLRESLIDEGRAREAPLRPEDLAGGFLLGNALRGLIPARLVAAAQPTTL